MTTPIMEDMAYTAEPESHISHFSPKETEHWSAKKWTEIIMKRDIVAHSRLKLDTRLDEFLKEAPSADREKFEDSRTKVLNIIQDAQEKHDTRYPVKAPESEQTLVETVKAGCREASETAYEYVQILDVMVSQAPEYVALAYGAVKILLVAQINYEEMKQNVETYLLKIKTKFQMIDHLTCYVPTAKLVDTIARLYDLFYRFAAKALKFYARSRLRHAFTSVLKPWKKLEPLVVLIEQTFTDVKDFVQFDSHHTGQMNLIVSQKILIANKDIANQLQGFESQISRLADILEELPVKFSKPGDVPQMRDLLRQRVDENLGRPTKNREQAVRSNKRDATPNGSEVASSDSLANLDEILGGLFVELHEHDDSCALQQRVLEQLPEMRPHRSKERNILKVDSVMSWIESPVSKLLWIDGNNLLQRHDFNASFAVPLIILGESTCETYLILRHFCGDNHSKPTGYRVLIQSLLRQLFKQRPEILKNKISSLTRDRSIDIKHLWALFVECLKEVNVECTFIFIDSIDALEATSTKESKSFDEGEFVLRQLNSLIKDSKLVIKVLLTAALAQTQPTQSKGLSELTPYQPASLSRQRRKLSLDIIEEDFTLAHKLIEIQEKRCQTIKFDQLPMLYQISSTIYTYDDGELRAFVVAELAGMDPKPFNTYSPLYIRAWSIDHNGKYFTKRYHDLVVFQFLGERDIVKLTYIPAGYLSQEAENRARLIERGRKYWKLASSIRYQQFMMAGKQTRIMLDQCTRPIEPLPPKQEFEDQLDDTSVSDLKPLVFIVCPPRIAVYVLRDLKWTTISVNEIEDIRFKKGVFDRLVLSKRETVQRLQGEDRRMKERLINAIEPYRTDQTNRSLLHLTGHTGLNSYDAQIILLCGKPGIGKTKTATCVAEYIQRPLLSISPGDFGDTPIDIAANMSNFLQLAQHWNAVLLLEDAEVILKYDLTENSTVVKAFVRNLDNYIGVIVMTSNHVQNFAKAVLSHVQLPIEYVYDHKRLWEVILEEFSDAHNVDTSAIRDHMGELEKRTSLNGWHINTRLKVALQMAHAKNEDLCWEHLQASFREVGTLTEEFSRAIYS